MTQGGRVLAWARWTKHGRRISWGPATQPGDTGGPGTGQRAPGGARGRAPGSVRARGRHLPGSGEGGGCERATGGVYKRGSCRRCLCGRERVTISLQADRGCNLHAPARHRARQGDGPTHHPPPLRHRLRRRRAGVKLIRRAQPHCVEILPTLAYPEVAAAYPELLERPVLAGGLLKSPQDISSILAVGAAGVSTSYQGLWRTT